MTRFLALAFLLFCASGSATETPPRVNESGQSMANPNTGNPSSGGNVTAPESGGVGAGASAPGRYNGNQVTVHDHTTKPPPGALPSGGGPRDGHAGDADALGALGVGAGGAAELATKAGINLSMGDLPSACRFAKAAIALEPANKKALAIEKQACRSDVPDPKAKAPSPQPRDAGSTLQGDAKLLRQDAGGGAIDAAKAAPDASPQQRRVLAGQEALSRNENQEALRIAEEGLAEAPKDPDLLMVKALALHKLNLPDDAMSIIDKVLAQRPGDADAHALKSALLAGKGDEAGMLEEMRLAAGADPKSYEDILREMLKGNVVSLFGKTAQRPARVDPALSRMKWVLGAAGLGFIVMLLLALALRAASSKHAAAAATVAAAHAPPLGPGVLVAGQYRVEAEIGRGGMGVVYGALDEKLQRKVALKQLEVDDASDEDLERFLKEARLVAQLKHPGIAAIYNVVEHGDDVLLVFELVEGKTLAKTLAGGVGLTLEQTAAVLAPLADALDHAHQLGIIHRDLKPSNVMIGEGGALKIMDFGIAHKSSAGATKTTQTASAGTLPYMAPEQGLGSVSKASDLYSLAVMTYEMLCGKRPFDGPDFVEPKLRKQFQPITRRRILPAGLDAFFASALDPDPTLRPNSGAAFLEAFKMACR